MDPHKQRMAYLNPNHNQKKYFFHPTTQLLPILKKELVSSIAQVKGSDLANQPASSVNGLLQGRAAGLEITSPNGSPEATPTIRIRGLSSIQGNNDPLFVIDGFIAGTDFNLLIKS